MCSCLLNRKSWSTDTCTWRRLFLSANWNTNTTPFPKYLSLSNISLKTNVMAWVTMKLVLYHTKTHYFASMPAGPDRTLPLAWTWRHSPLATELEAIAEEFAGRRHWSSLRLRQYSNSVSNISPRQWPQERRTWLHEHAYIVRTYSGLTEITLPCYV